jgi:hypothetical protein
MSQSKILSPRIISASRRTDIPAFYADWFMNRIRAGYCKVPNPYNRNQVSTVSLKPKDLDVIVFWTRNPRPLLPHLDELDRMGYRYYFQYTLMDNPRWLDPKSPSVDAAIKTFCELSRYTGAERVIWRYDPMVFTPHTHAGFHLETFDRIATALSGFTNRVVISVMDPYPKAAGRMRQAIIEGGEVLNLEEPLPEWFIDLIDDLVKISRRCEMEIVSCAEHLDLRPLGVLPGKCVDDGYIQRIFGLTVGEKKDPSQREECGCVISKDIGVYDTCLFGCRYCYATKSFDVAKAHHQQHDPNNPAIIPVEEINTEEKPDFQLPLL